MTGNRAAPLVFGSGRSVSALSLMPRGARACYVFAHGAGAGMTHPFMEAAAQGLAARAIGTFRFQFPYMERGSRRPDSPAVCHATVRAAVMAAATQAPRTLLVAGGKSFGGRMASQAQAEEPLRGVAALAFFGFPLHPAGKPAVTRADHLAQVKIPMLFLQGGNDRLADAPLLRSLMTTLGRDSTLVTAAGADHSFHVPKRSGSTDASVLETLLDQFASWLERLR